MQKITVKEPWNIFWTQANQPKQNHAEEALSGTIYAGFKNGNSKLNNASYYFTEGVHVGIASNASLDDLFERSLECWTQWSSLKGLITQGALNSPRFVYPGAKRTSKNLRNEIESTPKKKLPRFRACSQNPCHLCREDQTKIDNANMQSTTALRQKMLWKEEIKRKKDQKWEHKSFFVSLESSTSPPRSSKFGEDYCQT